MVFNELPGNQHAYKIEAGQGLRFAIGNQLACLLARPEDLGQPMCGAVLSGVKGSRFPLHRHAQSHEAWFVLEGTITLTLDGKQYSLTSGSYVNIPPGTPHAFTFEDHRSRLISWLFHGTAHKLYESLGKPYGGTVYPESNGDADWNSVPADVDLEWLTDTAAEKLEPGTTAPAANVPFVLGPYEGERMLAAEQLFTFLGTEAHSGGNFISLLTEGPTGPEIPRHYHDRVTETFFCIKGALQMWVNDGYITLEPGDFLHVPPGTVHSYKLVRDDTRFIGFLMPGHFENFFRYLCEPFDGHIYPQNPPPFKFDRVLKHMSELDLHMVGRPTPPPVGAA